DPRVATWSFGIDGNQRAVPLTVAPGLRSLFDRALPGGAVLDLPAYDPPLGFHQRQHRVLLAIFHRRPFTSCFTSFRSPLADDVRDIAIRLPDPRAAMELHALGFRSIILHEEELAEPWRRHLLARLARLATGDPRIVEA